MHANPLDMRMAAHSGKESGRPHVPHASRSERNAPSMTHPAPDHITVPADKLQAIANAASRLFCEASLLLDEAGAATGGSTPRHPLPADGNVYDLTTYRLHRHGGAA